MAELNNSSSGKWSETDASNTSPSPDGWASGTFPNQVEPIGRSTMGAIKRFWDRINGTVTSTGSANAYVYTPTNVSYPTAYVQGETYTFKANFANTGAATLNINGLGATNIFKQSTSGPVALTGGEIQTNQMVNVIYDGAQFQINSALPPGNSFTTLGVGAAASGTYALNVVQAGTNQAYFGSTGSNSSNVTINNAAGGQGSYLVLSNAGTPLWYVENNATNQFQIQQAGSANYFLTANPNGNLVLGSAQTFSIAPTGAANFFFANSSTGLTISNTSGTASYTAIQFDTGGGSSAVGSISVGAASTSYNTTSDKRLKTNVQSLTNTSAIIDAIKPVTYNWQFLEGNPSGIGFLAQDLYEIYPDAVTVGDNGITDENGNVEKQWSVDYSKLVPLLVAEIQSLRKRLVNAGIQ